MYRVELAKAFHRWRTWLLAAAIAGIPAVIVIATKLSAAASRRSGQDAPPFLFQIATSGLYAALTGLAVVQPFFLPLAAGLFAGDAVAGEAQAGTLRYLLVRPVRRTPSDRREVRLGHDAAGRPRAGDDRERRGVRGRGVRPARDAHAVRHHPVRCRCRCCGSCASGALHGPGDVGDREHRPVHLHAHRLGPGAAVATIVIAIASQILGSDLQPARRSGRTCPPTAGSRSPACSASRWTGAAMRSGLLVSAAYTAVFLTLALLGLPPPRHHGLTAARSTPDGLDDLLGELGELLQAGDALGLQALHERRRTRRCAPGARRGGEAAAARRRRSRARPRRSGSRSPGRRPT